MLKKSFIEEYRYIFIQWSCYIVVETYEMLRLLRIWSFFILFKTPSFKNSEYEVEYEFYECFMTLVDTYSLIYI